MSMKGLTSSCHDVGLLLIRVMLAVVFVYHGGGKLFGWFGGGGLEATAAAFGDKIGLPFPMVGAVLAGSAEFFGGIVLLIGTGTRLATVPMVFTMLVASFVAHSGFDIRQGGMEYALTLAVVLAGLGLTGPGRLTVGAAVLGFSASRRRAMDATHQRRIDIFR